MRSTRAKGSTGVAIAPCAVVTGARGATVAAVAPVVTVALFRGTCDLGALVAAGGTAVAVTVGRESTRWGALLGGGGGTFAKGEHADRSARLAKSDRFTETTACWGVNCDCPR